MNKSNNLKNIDKRNKKVKLIIKRYIYNNPCLIYNMNIQDFL